MAQERTHTLRLEKEGQIFEIDTVTDKLLAYALRRIQKYFQPMIKEGWMVTQATVITKTDYLPVIGVTHRSVGQTEEETSTVPPGFFDNFKMMDKEGSIDNMPTIKQMGTAVDDAVRVHLTVHSTKDRSYNKVINAVRENLFSLGYDAESVEQWNRVDQKTFDYLMAHPRISTIIGNTKKTMEINWTEA